MYSQLTAQERKDLLQSQLDRYQQFKEMGLKLDMSRGKPCAEQLDLSMKMLEMLSADTKFTTADYRNYGILDGIPELKNIFKELLNLADNEIIVAGNSSLNLMYDCVQQAMQFGVGGNAPLNNQGKIKWLCPVPGYDRHFAITELFGIEMINVPMTDDGVDMDIVEELVKDTSVKGMWCVPKYSNPEGIIYSDDVVKRLANLRPTASDFRIYWDNAYMIHSIDNQSENLADILSLAKQAGNEDIVYMFGSTSKISFAGAGVAFIAGSEKNMNEIKKRMSYQTIGPDKLTQYAHYLFFQDANGMLNHMKKHEEILRPKFEMVLDILSTELKDTGIASWKVPKGGYFISCDLAEGTAKRAIALAKEAGVIFTPAGSTYTYKIDPKDSNVRIAPTLPPINELKTAMQVFCTAVKIAYLEKYQG